MAFGLRRERVTTDVDAAVRRTEGPVRRALTAVAKHNALDLDWVNSAMVRTLRTAADTEESALYDGRRLKVVGASPKRMLAMKVMGLRDKDLDDIRPLMEITGIRNVKEIDALIQEHYTNERPGAEALAQVRLPILAEWLGRET